MELGKKPQYVLVSEKKDNYISNFEIHSKYLLLK